MVNAREVKMRHTTSSLQADACVAEEQLKAHLVAALDIADELAIPPEIGARLQEVIDLVEACVVYAERGAGKSRQHFS